MGTPKKIWNFANTCGLTALLTLSSFTHAQSNANGGIPGSAKKPQLFTPPGNMPSIRPPGTIARPGSKNGTSAIAPKIAPTNRPPKEPVNSMRASQFKPQQVPTPMPAASTLGTTGDTGSLKSKDGTTDFAHANPEDITNENFPNLIESFDYPNADIGELVKAISKLTGKNFILDKDVGGKISIIAPSQITVAEAYKAFLTALALNGLTVVPSGNFLKIRRINFSAKENIETYAGGYFPNSDQLITRIIKLKYINAEEIQKTLQTLINTGGGGITAYSPTNSLIVTDLGSNVERITNILSQIDVPGFEEKLVVIGIKYARSKDIADLIDQIINKGEKKNNQFGGSIPRFRSGTASASGSSSGAASYSLVIPDSRTNSIIVVGNAAGITRIRELVKKLDFRIRPEDGGGVYVYYVRYGEAEKIANVLNGIASESSKSKSQANSGSAPISPIGGVAASAPTEAIFGGDVKVTADKDNNNLIIVASKQDYELVRTILSRIDMQRDQVFVKAIIMEMNATAKNNWGINYYKFAPGSTNGMGRIGFAGNKINEIADPLNDSGMILGFGSGSTVSITTADGKSLSVPSLLGLIKFFKTNTDANILSTPQISALDNEEAEIEVGENVPISQGTTSTGGAVASNIERKDLTLLLKITPFISPDTDSVRMKIEQKIQQVAKTTVSAAEIASRAVAYTTRSVKTNIVVNSSDTAVIGGLMEDKEDETVTKVPILGDIPIIGWLFKSKILDKVKKNLLLFITPKIIRTSQDNNDLINSKLNERIDFIQQNMGGRDPHGSEVDKLPRRAQNLEESQEYLEEAPIAPKIEESDSDNGVGDSGTDANPGDFEEGE